MTSFLASQDRERARRNNGQFGFLTRAVAENVRLAEEQPLPTVDQMLSGAGFREPPFRQSYSPFAKTRRRVRKNLLATMPPPSQMKAVPTQSGTLHMPYPAAIREFADRSRRDYVAVPVALTKADGSIVKKFVSFTLADGSMERNALDQAPEGDEADLYRELDFHVDRELAGRYGLRWEEAPGLGKDPRHWARLLAGKARDRQAVAAAVVSSTAPRPVPAERIARFFSELVEDLKPYEARR